MSTTTLARESQAVPCRWCHALAGRPCVTVGTSYTPAGGYHPTRLDDARDAHSRAPQ